MIGSLLALFNPTPLPPDSCLYRQCIVMSEPKPSMLEVLVLVVAVAAIMGVVVAFLQWKHEHFNRIRLQLKSR